MYRIMEKIMIRIIINRVIEQMTNAVTPRVTRSNGESPGRGKPTRQAAERAQVAQFGVREADGTGAKTEILDRQHSMSVSNSYTWI
jgi:hypothetical protein